MRDRIYRIQGEASSMQKRIYTVRRLVPCRIGSIGGYFNVG